MDWNEIAREQYRQQMDRLETELTGEERAVIERLFPAPSEMGGPRELDMREVFNATRPMLVAGCLCRESTVDVLGRARLCLRWLRFGDNP
ncbi:MAG: hypothetical protein MJA29_10915 [Candidatus Omnitrophica bacterium]|nr:hypothetical protein [Candidatus Omnitrophota bacterium]